MYEIIIRIRLENIDVMAKHSKTLLLMASKLGLTEEDKVLSKAAEFERLLQTKSSAGSNMTVTSKIVICLDLAANMLGAEFDGKMAVKYSGLRGPSYANSRKIVENLLQINGGRMTTALICVTLQCGSAQQLADKILHDYQKASKMDIDLNLPQYVCMAVYQACRINKIKIPKGKIVEKSRLKPAQWNKLNSDWTKFVDENFAGAKKKNGKTAEAVEKEEENIEQMDVDTNQKLLPIEPQIEPYEVWKQRMLETAYKELRELEKEELSRNVEKVATPRRSPRKTPQKYSPYRSTSHVNSVRLLFQ